MEHILMNVVDVEIARPYTLRLVFDDGSERVIDFQPVLCGFYYGPLRDLDFFNQVRLDKEIGTIVWPNDADFDPATLYYWHEGAGQELAQRAKQWEAARHEFNAG